MTAARNLRIVLTGLALAAVLALPRDAHAQAFAVPCKGALDLMGYSVATNGDYNGDGVPDIAMGAPCYYAHDKQAAGRVVVISGKDGRKLFRKKGNQVSQWFGAGVSFVPDQNGDGRDELAVGSPGYDVTGLDRGEPFAGTIESAGRVDVYAKGKRRLRIFGSNANSGFGATIVPTSDLNDDGRSDFLIGAESDSKPDGRSQTGRVWLASAKDGELLGYRVGPRPGKSYGRSLATTDDMDGDGKKDFLAGSDELNINDVFNAGAVDLVSTADYAGPPLLQVLGARGDRLARSVDWAGNVNDDNKPDFIVGAFGADDNGINEAGLVTLVNTTGYRNWVRQDDVGKVQDNAHFGFSVCTMGDINGDGIKDFAASAPGFDSVFDKRLQTDAGRVVTLSGDDGRPLWSVEGSHTDDNFGYSLASHIDFNLDEVEDLVVGTPGDDPLGRRTAGAVRILSGKDGKELFRVPGRRGLETRLVTVEPEGDKVARLRTWNRSGKSEVVNTPVLDGVKLGELDVTVLNDRKNPLPKYVQAAVSTGHGSNSSRVEVYRMGKRSKKVDSFEAFPGAQFGVECAGGEADGQPFDELVCVQASSLDGQVLVRIFRRLDEQQPFYPILEFTAFTAGEMANNALPINPDGGTVALGDVTGSSDQEIIIGTNRGVPMVKIFSRTGSLIRSFIAYDPRVSFGVDVASIDPAGSGVERILTTPRLGETFVKMFTGAGERVVYGRENVPVAIYPRNPGYVGGARVAAADVDFDDQQEMLVLIPTPYGNRELLAYEMDNGPVRGFLPYDPAPFGTIDGGAIAGTDRFVRD